MHRFYDYLAAQLDKKLRDRRIVVWYDPRSEFAEFVDELPPLDPPEGRGGLPRVWINDLQTHVARYDGSFFALKGRIEPIAALDEPDALLVYLPGVKQDRHQSVLMEIEKGGDCYEWGLKQQARNALRASFTDGEIDELLDPDGVGYRDVQRLLRRDSERPASLLKLALGAGSSEVLLSRWIVEEDLDAAIEDKGATPELFKLVSSRLGLKLAEGTTLAKARHQVVRYVLVNEFRHDLDADAPEALELVPTPSVQEEHRRIHEVATTVRRNGDRYAELADGIEQELKLRALSFDAATLGSIDTFRFEEAQLLTHAADRVVAKDFDAALEVVERRGRSFWLDRDVARRAQWEACRLAAELGREVKRVRPQVKKTSGGPERWVAAYAEPGGWFEVDRAQRALEAWVASMDQDPEERLEQAINLVRRDHETLLEQMAEGYSAALVEAKWNVPDVLHQTRIYPELVEKAGGRVAYFFVDAMRYEMGAELAQLLEDAEDLRLVPAAVALPSITHVGMAALLPGASASFSVIEHKGRLASKIDDAIMPGLAERQRLVKSRRPDATDLGMGTLLTKSNRQLKKAIGDAPLLIVRSQSIDKTGETDGGYMARQIMDAVIGNVARAVRKLAKLGVEHFVITADHGHQFTAGKESHMLMDKPIGETVEQHRRNWAGRGGQTSGASVRVSGAELGYDTDLDFIFPTGLAVFKAGGDLAFHHGGISLQEMIVPVLSLRMPVAATDQTTDPNTVFLDEHPAAITNRMFSVRVTATQLLGDEPVAVRIVVVESRPKAGEIAGNAGMATGAESFDRATGIVRLVPNTAAQVGIMLTNQDAKSVRIVAQDPHTDAILAQSDELPVKLGLVR